MLNTELSRNSFPNALIANCNVQITCVPGYFLERAIPVPNNSKADRATPLKDYIYDGHVYVDIQDNKLRKTFQDEFRAFPNGEHDDIVDAAAHAFNYINQEFIGNDIFEIVEI